MRQPRSKDGKFLKIPRERKLNLTPRIDELKLDLGVNRILVVPDIHFPKHDPAAVDLLLRRAKKFKPTVVVLLGDVLDCESLSSWKKKATADEVFNSIAAEVESAKPFFAALKRLKATTFWLEGNHEYRRQRLIDDNPGLVGLDSLGPRQFFSIPDWVKWVPRESRLKVGNCYFEHGDRILNTRSSATIAKSMHQRRPHSNTFVGHWHCVDRYTRVEYSPDNTHSPHTTASVGHLSDPNEHHYVNLPNWTQGWGEIVMWWEDGKRKFSFDQIELVGYKYARGGVIYE